MGKQVYSKSIYNERRSKIKKGLILSIKEIFNSLYNKKSSISKYLVKASYIEIINHLLIIETVK